MMFHRYMSLAVLLGKVVDGIENGKLIITQTPIIAWGYSYKKQTSRMLLPLLVYILPLVNTLNVFIWSPVIGQSHVNFNGNIADLLHKAGHNVTVLSMVQNESLKPFGTKENVTKILVRLKHGVEQWDISATSGAVWEKDQDPENTGFYWDALEPIWVTMTHMMKEISENETLMQTLTNSKCDVGIFEANELVSVAALELIGCRKFAVVSAFGHFDPHYSIAGIPQFTSFIPSFMTPYTDKMTFYQRFLNWKLMIEGIIAFNKHENHIQQVMDKYRPGFPKIQETLLKKSAIILINANEFTESPRLTTNMIQYVGGCNCYEKPLSEEADRLLSIRNRTVLFSLGSFAKSCHMPVTIKKAFAEAFSSFPDVTFIWKYEDCVETEFDKSNYKNIEFSKWVPQNELLNDPRLVLFITHGGMNSILEASHSGTPMITIPIFADQMINARNAVERGIAIKLDRTAVNKEILVELIGDLISENSIYRIRALNLKRILAGRPALYRQNIVDWIERISLENGPIEHLALQTREMSWIKILSIDILAVFIVVISLFVSFIYFVVKFLLDFVRANFVKVKHN